MDGIYQIVIGGNNTNGEFGENVCHYKVTGTSGGDDAYVTAIALAGTWVTQCLGHLQACVGTDVELNVMTVKKIDAPVGPTCFNAILVPGTGIAPTASLAAAVDIRILPGGSGNRAGHWYLFGLPKGAFTIGVINPSYAADVQTFANDLLAPLAPLGGTANFGTWTKKTSHFTPATANEIVYDKVTALNKRTIPVL